MPTRRKFRLRGCLLLIVVNSLIMVIFLRALFTSNNVPFVLRSMSSTFDVQIASSGEHIVTGEAVIDFPDAQQPPNLYLTWTGGEPPTEEKLLLRSGALFTRSGTAPWTPSFLPTGTILKTVLFDLGGAQSGSLGWLLLPRISADMVDWTYETDAQVNDHPVRVYTQDNLSVTVWQIFFPQYGSIFRSASAEISLGQADKLPYRLRYTLHLQHENAQDALIFDIRLQSLNDPVDFDALIASN